jgi:hypothetical protein
VNKYALLTISAYDFDLITTMPPKQERMAQIRIISQNQFGLSGQAVEAASPIGHPSGTKYINIIS